MTSFKGLFHWAEQTAEGKAEQHFEEESNRAETAETRSQEAAFTKSGLSKTALKNPKKLKHNTKYATYKVEVALAETTRKQAIIAADVNKDNDRARELKQNLGFVAETTKGKLAANTVEWLIQQTGSNPQMVTALQAMMEAQSNSNDINLAQMILSQVLSQGKDSVIQIAATCSSLLAQNVNEQDAFKVAHFNSECSDAGTRNWILGRAVIDSSSLLQGYIQYLTQNINNVANALLALQRCGNNYSVLNELIPLLTQPALEIQWLLTHYGQGYFSRLVYQLEMRHEKIKDMHDLVTFNGPNQNYAVGRLVDWMGAYGVARVHQTLQNTLYEVNPRFVELYIMWGGTPGSAVQFLYLIRLQALLETAPGTLLTVYQADVNYASSLDPPSRTGFLNYTFVNGDVAVIHTHWNNTKKRLVSMHIQDASGHNGVEINTWTHFLPIQQAVRDSHNNPLAAHRPTTTPAHGLLSL